MYQAEAVYTGASEAERSDASKNERETEKAENERTDVLQNARITISREDALAIQRAVSDAGEAAARADGGNPPLKIDVYVESIESEKADNGKGER